MPDASRAKVRRGILERLAATRRWPNKGKEQLARHLGIAAGSVSTYLSEGFPEIRLSPLRDFFVGHGVTFEVDVWSKDDGLQHESIRILREGVNIASVLFEDAYKFLTIRAPSKYAKVPEKYNRSVDGRGPLDLNWKRDAPSSAFMHHIWTKIFQRQMEGQVITSIARVSALVELWAAVELVMRKELQDKIAVYLIPIAACGDLRGDPHPVQIPIIGARVVNDVKCLLSVPVSSRMSSHTPLLFSRQTAKFLYAYANQLTDEAISHDLTALPLAMHVAEAIEIEFDSLMKFGADTATRYGDIATFRTLREKMEEMCTLAENHLWYPPLA